MIQINLLGPCSLEYQAAASQPRPISSAKARQLLGYLACHPNRNLCRESVIATLWGDTQENQGRRYLRQSLWQVQNVIRPGNLSPICPLIEAKADWIRLNLHPEVSFDVLRLERLHKESRRLPTRQIPRPLSFQEVTSLYSGPFLEGCYEGWCVQQRERFQDMYVELLKQMMDQEFTEGNFEDAADIAHKILDVYPTDEDAHWTIMSHYLHLGDRSGALRQYQACVQILREELDTLPGEKLNLLRELIRRDLGEKPTIVPPIPAETDPSRDPLIILQEIQRQINDLRREMQAVKEQINFQRPSSEKGSPPE